MLYIIHLIAAIFGNKTAPVEPTAASVTAAPAPALGWDMVDTSPDGDWMVIEFAPKAPIVVHDPVWTDSRKATFYPAGTMVSIWGINQKFDGDFIGFWHVTGAEGQAIILTNNAMSTSEVDMVALDDRALVVIGDSAEVRHYQQGHDHKCVIHGMEFTRANVQGNFALHISNQIMFMGNLRVVGNKVVSPTGLVGTIYSNY